MISPYSYTYICLMFMFFFENIFIPLMYFRYI